MKVQFHFLADSFGRMSLINAALEGYNTGGECPGRSRWGGEKEAKTGPFPAPTLEEPEQAAPSPRVLADC